MNWDAPPVSFSPFSGERSLRGAARIDGVDQATVGRRLATLERALGSTLFLRKSGGYVPTSVGEVALRTAEKMEKLAVDLVRQAQGVDQRLAGEVRVTDRLRIATWHALEQLQGAGALGETIHPDSYSTHAYRCCEPCFAWKLLWLAHA